MRIYGQKTINSVRDSFPAGTVFSFDDFLSACPFTMEELRVVTRKADVAQWRQIGMTWYAMEHISITKAAKFFNKDRTNAHYAMVCVRDRKFSPALKKKVDEVLNLKSE